MRHFIFAVFLGLQSTLVFATPSDITPETIQSAQAMLNQAFGDWHKLEKLNAVELAKKLNALVYHFCTPPQENIAVANLNDLFKSCHTACGGRSYVLRGLLAVYGIDSKYHNIYNIPIQGNHSAVEADIRGRQLFLDPTFGTFFTHRAIDDIPMSLDDVNFSFEASELPAHVYQAKPVKSLQAIPSMTLEALYALGFESNYFQLAAYVEHEAQGSPNDESILYLSAYAPLEDNHYALGCLDALNVTEASLCFLEQTNKLYAESSPDKQVSYSFSALGYHANLQKIDLLHLQNLKLQQYYRVTFLVENPSTKVLPLHLTNQGRGLVLPSYAKLVTIKPGLSKYTVYLKASSKQGTLSLYTTPGVKYGLNLYGIQVEAV